MWIMNHKLVINHHKLTFIHFALTVKSEERKAGSQSSAKDATCVRPVGLSSESQAMCKKLTMASA